MMKKYQLNLLLSVLAILSLLGITHSFSAYQSDKNRHPSKARIEQYQIVAEIIATNYSLIGVEDLPDMENVNVSSNSRELADSLDTDNLTYSITFSPSDSYYKITVMYPAKKVDNKYVFDVEQRSTNVMEWTITYKDFVSTVVMSSISFVITCLVMFKLNFKPKTESDNN